MAIRVHSRSRRTVYLWNSVTGGHRAASLTANTIKIMTKTILKFIALTALTAGIVGAPVLSRAADAAAAGSAAKTNSAGDKFYGPITAVDTNAMTITVNDQTFTVTPKTEITLAKDGSPATLAAATVGESARGSYIKASNGK